MMICHNCQNYGIPLEYWGHHWVCNACAEAMLKAAVRGYCCASTPQPRTEVDRLMDAARRDVAANERRRRAAK
jgi:hypothetical protein